MAKVVRLILTYERRGIGTHDDPVRLCAQLFTLSGQLIAECDPMPKGQLETPHVEFHAAQLYHIEDAI